MNTALGCSVTNQQTAEGLIALTIADAFAAGARGEVSRGRLGLTRLLLEFQGVPAGERSPAWAPELEVALAEYNRRFPAEY